MKTRTRWIALLAVVMTSVAVGAAKPKAPPKAPPPVPKMKIGVVLPSAQLGQGNTGTDVAEPVRTTLISYLNGPKTTLVPVSARIPVQVDAEAQEAGMDYVVFVSVKTKKSGGAGFGKFLSAAAPLAGMIPGMSSSMGGYVAGSVASQVAAQAAQSQAMEAQQQAMQQISGAAQNSVKKGDQVTLEYRVMRPGDPTPLVTKSVLGKATENGEDVLSPLLEQAAVDMLTAVTAARAPPQAAR